jgi:hypothetical protein
MDSIKPENRIWKSLVDCRTWRRRSNSAESWSRLIQVEPGWFRLIQLVQVEPGWARLSQVDPGSKKEEGPGWVKSGWTQLIHVNQFIIYRTNIGKYLNSFFSGSLTIIFKSKQADTILPDYKNCHNFGKHFLSSF